MAVGGRSLLLTADGGKTWSGQPLKNASPSAAYYGLDGHIWLAGQTLTGGRERGAAPLAGWWPELDGLQRPVLLGLRRVGTGETSRNQEAS